MVARLERTLDQRFIIDTGASIVTVPGGEVYTAIQTKLLDAAAFGSPDAWAGMKMYEVCKYYINPSVIPYDIVEVIMNLKTLNDMPADLQTRLLRVLVDQTASMYELPEPTQRSVYTGSIGLLGVTELPVDIVAQAQCSVVLGIESDRQGLEQRRLPAVVFTDQHSGGPKMKPGRAQGPEILDRQRLQVHLSVPAPSPDRASTFHGRSSREGEAPDGASTGAATTCTSPPPSPPSQAWNA